MDNNGNYYRAVCRMFVEDGAKTVQMMQVEHDLLGKVNTIPVNATPHIAGIDMSGIELRLSAFMQGGTA